LSCYPIRKILYLLSLVTNGGAQFGASQQPTNKILSCDRTKRKTGSTTGLRGRSLFVARSFGGFLWDPQVILCSFGSCHHCHAMPAGNVTWHSQHHILVTLDPVQLCKVRVSSLFSLVPDLSSSRD
jgi:hypothetical protein